MMMVMMMMGASRGGEGGTGYGKDGCFVGGSSVMVVFVVVAASLILVDVESQGVGVDRNRFDCCPRTDLPWMMTPPSVVSSSRRRRGDPGLGRRRVRCHGRIPSRELS
jgi:hypothetical protein